MWLAIATDRQQVSLCCSDWHTCDEDTICLSVTHCCAHQSLTTWIGLLVSTGQEIQLTLWKPKVHHRAHNSPPLVPILRQVNPVHGLPSYFFNIHCNIILSSTSRSSKRFLALRSRAISCHSHTTHAPPIAFPILYHRIDI